MAAKAARDSRKRDQVRPRRGSSAIDVAAAKVDDVAFGTSLLGVESPRVASCRGVPNNSAGVTGVGLGRCGGGRGGCVPVMPAAGGERERGAFPRGGGLAQQSESSGGDIRGGSSGVAS